MSNPPAGSSSQQPPVPPATQGGACPKCQSPNLYSAMACSVCGARLPWADALVTARQVQASPQNSPAPDTLALSPRSTQPLAKQSAQPPTAQMAPQSPLAMPAAATPTQPLKSHAQAQPLPPDPYGVYFGSLIGAWGAPFEAMDSDGALHVGLLCIGVFIALVVAGSHHLLQQVDAMLAPWRNLAAFGHPSDSSAQNLADNPNIWVYLIVAACIPCLAVVVSSSLMRKLFGQDFTGSFADDVLVAGVSLLPLGLYAFTVSFLSFANYELIGVLFVFATCYTAIAMFNGYTIVARIKDAAAAFSVPATLLLSGWLAKVIFFQLVSLSSSVPAQASNDAPPTTPSPTAAFVMPRTPQPVPSSTEFPEPTFAPRSESREPKSSNSD